MTQARKTTPCSHVAEKAAGYIEAHADEKITLAMLGARLNISPSYLQKCFKQVFGISPRMYQDAIRQKQLRDMLREGHNTTDAIYAAGYGSLSRVYGDSGRPLGMSLKRYQQGGIHETIYYAIRTTRLGPMLMAATDKGVCFVQFDDIETRLVNTLKAEFPKADVRTSNNEHGAELDKWIAALNHHLEHLAPSPELPLDMRGTAFQMLVWNFLRSIPEGHVLSYTELAEKLGKPKAVRAVASACAANRIGVLIPCHRVLRSDGSLGGYRWGLERKKALLEGEQQ